MAKTKKKTARGVSANSSTSKNSTSTRQASNCSSSSSPPPPSEISGVASGKFKKKSSSRKPKTSKASKIPSKPAPKTPEPLRKRSQSAPVDLDDMADTLHTNHHHEMAISPAETFDTVPLSASSSSSRSTSSSHHKRRSDVRDEGSNDYLPVSLLNFDSPKNGQRRNGDGNNSKIVIEHKIKDSNNNNNNGRSKSVIGRGASLFWLVKPLLLILLLVALSSGAASVYGWLFRFPSLNKQVKELEDQVNRLNLEVDRLETENDRYEYLNDRLNITVDDLNGVREDLNGTVFELEGVADALNTTKDQIVDQIEQLKGQNEEYANLNEGLQDNVLALDQEVKFFRDALQELSDEHSILQNTTTALQDLAVSFTNTTIDQNETLQVLKDTLDGFQNENDRLEDFNKNLESALVFLNDTLFSNGNLVESSTATLGEITEDLGERVLEQQRLTLLQLEISYRQLLAGWDCDYRDVFRSEPFGQDYNLPFPTDSGDGTLLPPEVEAYIEERVLSKMCLDPEEFSAYLSSPAIVETNDGGNTGELTSNELIRAVTMYTEDAMEYYFPAGNDDGGGAPDDADGIILSEWVDASFRCELLESPFVSSSVRERRRQLFHLRRGRW